jgi:hypothetical protein
MQGRRRPTAPLLDLDDVPADLRAVLEEAVAGREVTVCDAGVPIGSLHVRPHVLEGTVVARPPGPEPDAPPRDGVLVVATAMKLSETARRRLSDELGADYLVVDIDEAPTTVDVLLTHPVSPQLLGILRRQFPVARVVITEIEDEELGVRYAGPVSRLLDAGASAYLPPRPIAELAATVHAYLTQGGEPALEAAERSPRSLPAPPGES